MYHKCELVTMEIHLDAEPNLISHLLSHKCDKLLLFSTGTPNHWWWGNIRQIVVLSSKMIHTDNNFEVLSTSWCCRIWLSTNLKYKSFYIHKQFYTKSTILLLYRTLTCESMLAELLLHACYIQSSHRHTWMSYRIHQ